MRVLIAIILMFGWADGFGQIIRAQPFHTSRVVSVVTDTLLLDSFPTQGAAFSLRKLRSSYTGNCIRVRRTSNNNEQDIGFVNNFLDTTSLKTFCSGTNGFVTTWYDQGDSARDASSSTAANQPKIYDSATASLSKRNNKVSLSLDGLDFLELTNAGAINQDKGYMYSFGVACNTNTATGVRTLFYTSGATIVTRYAHNLQVQATASRFGVSARRNDNDATAALNSNTNYSNTNLTLTNIRLEYANNDVFLYQNGSAVGSNTNYLTNGNTANTASQRVSLFSTQSGATGVVGNSSEIIIYNSDQSSNRTSIENNINRNWLIY